jgi:hypothetical protein
MDDWVDDLLENEALEDERFAREAEEQAEADYIKAMVEDYCEYA